MKLTIALYYITMVTYKKMTDYVARLNLSGYANKILTREGIKLCHSMTPLHG